jgi:hypothetical protein
MARNYQPGAAGATSELKALSNVGMAMVFVFKWSSK